MSTLETLAGQSTAAPGYTRVAVVLHWVTAAAIIAIIALGLYGASETAVWGEEAINIHKVLGIMVLALTLARVAWRLTHKAPPMPRTMTPLLKRTAQGAHLLFYILLIAMPLSGWWMTSAFPERHPIELFSFQIPFLPVPLSMEAAGTAHTFHTTVSWVMIGLVVLHIGAALKHQFIDRDGLLGRMSFRSPA